MRAVVHAGILLTFLTLSGCLVLPLPAGKHKLVSGTDIREKNVEFVRPGQTTRYDVFARFGEPWVVYDDLQVMVYYAETVKGRLIWGFAGPHFGDSGVKEFTSVRYLFIKLDAAERVERIAFARTERHKAVRELVVRWLKQTEEAIATGRFQRAAKPNAARQW